MHLHGRWRDGPPFRLNIEASVLRADRGNCSGSDLSLPESIGGLATGITAIPGSATRPTCTDYRVIGFTDEAASFRDWLEARRQDADKGEVRTTMQLMDGIDGRRHALQAEETLDI